MNRRTALLTALGTMAAGTTLAAPSDAREAVASRPSAIRTRDGLELPFAIWGKGPPILLVHAWSLSSAMWAQQVFGLTQAGYSVVTFDRRGHGRAPNNGAGYDFDTLADDLAAVIDQLGLTDVTLVAHSMGSGEAVRYLARHGDRKVRRLVLLAPITPFLRKTADNPAGLPVAIQQKLLSDIATDFPKWVAGGTRPFFRAETSPETRAWMANMMLGTPIAVAHACAQAFMGEDFRPDLKALRLPTLVVHGDRDASAPLALTGKRSAEMIAGARLEVIPGAPHGLFITDAERVNHLISEFARA
jgi:non-heme chloroperoxidase